MQTNNQVKVVPIDKIKFNPRNDRSMLPDDLSIIADSICRFGMMQRPVVFEEGDHYVLLAGHRRIGALKQIQDRLANGEELPEGSPLKTPLTEVEVNIMDKPEDEFVEQEILSEANIFRTRPEELQEEVQKSEAAWNAFDENRKKQYREILLRRFTRIHSGTTAYERDPKGFIRDNFRPSDEYVRMTTGRNLSKNTIKKASDGKLAPDTDTKDTEEKSPEMVNQELMVKIKKQATALLGLVQVADAGDPVINGQFDRLANEIETTLSFLTD